ncbi:PIN domain-containing protein [Sorangium sp. So ce327]|jgi:predicted nucleic acid-binding protein|uniref:type II toxin-antitoxin system VapC family toxin n=1 Tax=unclassified Sorangium TaxID=2621164 RepID=UPI003F61653D
MILRKVLLDTNLYIGWLNRGIHEDLMIGPGLVRYLSAVVQMELRAGATTLPARRAVDHLCRAYRGVGRIVAPDAEVFDHAGRTLRRLREAGREVHRASLVNDVLIALSARSLGATVLTADEDYDAIRAVLDFKLERVVA